MAASVPYVVPTKVRPPMTRAGTVVRPRLSARLGTALEMPGGVGLVCAPAGWGKTTLVASWLAGERLPACWLQLDAGDNDPARLWAHLIAAIEEQIGDLGLRSLVAQSPSELVPRLVGALDGHEVVLVLDDYHEVVDPGIHESVDQLLQWLPPEVHAVVSSRVEPPLAVLSRLRVGGQLAEVRAGDLAFSPQEAAVFLVDSLDLPLETPQVERLVGRTEGWAAGIYLAALSMQRVDDPNAFVEQFAGDDRLVVDYLSSQLLDRQSTATLDFLYSTCILDRLSGPLCDAVTGATGSAERLRTMERSNLLLVPLDSTGEWYRYHHLMADWLRTEVAQRGDAFPAGHRRAAAWFRENGEPEEALRHAFAADDRDLAAGIVERHWHEALVAGRLVTLADWFVRLGDDLVGSSAALSLGRAQLALNTAAVADDVEHWLGRAQALAPKGDRPLRALIHRNLALHHRIRGALESAEVDCRQALALVEREADKAEDLTLLGAVLCLRGSHDEGREVLLRAIALTQQHGLRLDELLGLSYLALLEYESGHHRQARSLAQQALDLVAGTTLTESPTLNAAHIVMASLAMDEGDLETAGPHIEGALRRAEAVRAASSVYLCLLAQARLASLQRHGAEARSAIARARQVLGSMAEPGRLAELVDVAERQLRSGTTAARGDVVGVEDLTERELSVLRLLPSDLSVREIGGELFVSHNTVKGHLKAIYRKLGVASRESCVARARSLGLL